MQTYNGLKNPVNLKQIQSQGKISNLNLILKDDLWNKEILLLRNGKYLTENIINKLINMGILEVNILLNNDIYDNEELRAIKDLKNNFLRSKTVFVLTRELREVRPLLRGILNNGFRERNLFIINDNKNLEKYFKYKKPAYIFIDNEFYIENKSILNKIINNNHVFLLIKNDYKNINTEELEAAMLDLSAKIVSMPVNLNHLNHLLDNCIDRDFCNLVKNK